MSEILIDDREFRVPLYGGVKTLGDVEGHPFHGNQYTGGLGSLLERISAPDSGFTYSMVTGHEPTTGYVLSIHKDREQPLDLDKLTLENLVDYTQRNSDLLTQPQNYLGAWHDPVSHRVFLDVSSVTTDAHEAARLAQEHDQLAYFDLSTMTSVPVAPKLKAAHENSRLTSHRLFRGAGRYADPRRSDRTLHQIERAPALRRGDRAGAGEDGFRGLGGAGSGNFGHGGRPGEVGGSSTVQLFHGTASSALKSIKAQGLRPAADKGGDTWWKITRGNDFNDPRRTIFSDALKANPALFEDRKASVYLIDDPSLAQHFADYATELHPGAEPVVLEVDIPKSAAEPLTKDEGTAEQYGAFRFKGTIKPEWIRGRVKFTRSGGLTVKALAEAAYRVFLAFIVDNAEVRTAASREGRLHKIADAHVSKLSVALRYAFAKGRKALNPDPVKNIDKAVEAVADALREVLPATLLKVVAAGGEVAVAGLRALGDVEGHPFHGNQWTDGGISSEGSVSKDHLDTRFPQAKKTVDGRTVRDEIPNLASIDASLTDYERLPGIREVKMSELSTDEPRFYSKTEEARTRALAERIRESGEISPLIVVFDGHKDGAMYVLEGGHRYDALRLLKAKSFPAVVVIDTEKLRIVQMRTAKRSAPVKKIGPLTMRFDATNQRVIDWADRHAAELIDGISETTRDAINNAVAEALEQGSIKDLYAEILDAVGNEQRAELIARTEVMTAANEGQREGWRQAVDEGVLPETTTVAWIATGDEGVCPLCEALDGQTRDIDGEYPDDGGDGPPLHPRCRCTEGISGAA
jgi:SPP1 gp7 family putative phage head morphogenesis protein